jgi:hypothetical protein
MAFDYTTVSNVFSYGNSAGTAVDPTNEATLMASLVTAMSRAVDVYCNQIFYQQTYVQQLNRAVVDNDGTLLTYLAVPTLAAPTAADWGGHTFTPLDLTQVDILPAPIGASLRVNGSFYAQRGTRLQLRLSYVGGWADMNAVPADFEWAVRSLCWWAYQKRSAPIDATAFPDVGMVVVPQAWPPHIKAMLRSYVRAVPM